MATPKSTYAIELKDETSGPASAAARALTDLRAKIDADIKALREMQAAMKRLQSGSSVNVAAYRELNAKIVAQKDAVAQAEATYLQMGGTFKALAPKIRGVVPPTNAAAGSFDKLLSKGRKIPGPLGDVVDTIDDLREVVAAGGIAGPIVVIGAALAIVAIAAIAGAVALSRYALASADAHRSERLRLEGLVALDRAQTSVASRALALQGSIDRVSSSVAIGRNDVERYARELHKAGLRGDALSVALEGAAITAAVQGDEAAASFVRQARAVRGSARAVRELAGDVKTRLGGIAARQMLSLDVQAAKLKENLAALFVGLGLDPFLAGLREVTALFSQSTSTGRALKTIAEAVFQPLIDGATRVLPIAGAVFKGLVIATLRLVIAVLRLRNSVRGVFAGTAFEKIDLVSAHLRAARLVLDQLTNAVNTLHVAMLPLLPALNLVARMLDALRARGQEALDALKSLDWRSIGTGLVDGLIGGIRDGRDRLVGTVRGLGLDAKNALESILDIHSPSRVFAELGLQIPRGLAQGIQRGAPIAAGAVEDLAGVPTLDRSSTSSVSVSVGDIHIHAQGGDARAIATTLRDEIARIFEGVAAEIGAPA